MKKLFLLAAALSATACGYRIDKGAAGGSDATLAPGTPLSFANVFASTIRPVCLECHSAPKNSGGFNFETYDTFADAARRPTILNAVKSRFMPDSQGRTLTAQQRALLVAWLEAGAPLEAPAGGSPPPPGASPQPGAPGTPAPCTSLHGPGGDHPEDPCPHHNQMEEIL